MTTSNDLDLTPEADGEPPVLVREAFSIRSQDEANWLIRRVVEARRYKQRVQEWADVEIRRAEREEAWLLSRYTDQLRSWLGHKLVEQRSARRSVNCPAGLVGLRAQPERLMVSDNAAVVRWCRRHLIDALQVRVTASGRAAVDLEQWSAREPDSIETAMTCIKSTLNTYAFSSGELPDGTCISPRQDVLYIR